MERLRTAGARLGGTAEQARRPASTAPSNGSSGSPRPSLPGMRSRVARAYRRSLIHVVFMLNSYPTETTISCGPFYR